MSAADRLRVRGAVLAVVAIAAVFAVRELRRPPHATAVYCDETTPPPPGHVTMLSAAWCPYCTKARNWLVARGVPYCEWDIERSATGAARHARADVKVIPQIFVADRVIVGFNPHELEQTLAAHDLLPLPDQGLEMANESTEEE